MDSGCPALFPRLAYPTTLRLGLLGSFWAAQPSCTRAPLQDAHRDRPASPAAHGPYAGLQPPATHGPYFMPPSTASPWPATARSPRCLDPAGRLSRSTAAPLAAAARNPPPTPAPASKSRRRQTPAALPSAALVPHARRVRPRRGAVSPLHQGPPDPNRVQRAGGRGPRGALGGTAAGQGAARSRERL